MKPTDVHMIFDELDALLERERQALLAGQFDGVSKILDQKVALIDKLEQLPDADRKQLTTLHAKITRNQELLDSSLRGIRAVADRLRDLRKLRKEMATYDQSGKKNVIAAATEHKMERRA